MIERLKDKLSSIDSGNGVYAFAKLGREKGRRSKSST